MTDDGGQLPVGDVAEALARELDADDFAAVERRLTRDCVYTIGDQRHVGPAAVVASYRAGSQMARQLFDNVTFDHRVVSSPRADQVLVEYRDELLAGADVFVHRSRQLVTIEPTGLVARIEDVPIPGEREALDVFMARHGIRRR